MAAVISDLMRSFHSALALSSFAALVLLVGCGGGGGGGSNGGSVDNSLVGTWTRSAMTIGGASVSCPGSIGHGGTTTQCSADTITFQSNGKYVGTASSGTWRLIGSTLSLTASGQTIALPFRYLSGGTSFETDVNVSQPSPFVETGVFTKTSVSRTDVVQNGSFESGVNAPINDGRLVQAGSADIEGWSIVTGNVDWLGPTKWVGTNGQRIVDLNGAIPGAIQQTVATVPGRSYLLQFDHAAEPDRGPRTSEVRVQIAGITRTVSSVASVGDTPGNMAWKRQGLIFTAANVQTTLILTTLDTQWPDTGPAIDNVTITSL